MVIERLRRALLVQAPADHTPPGLAWEALYPSLPPAGTTPRGYKTARTIAAATDSQLLAPDNAARRMLSIVNDGAGTLYLALGPVASAVQYAVALGAGATFTIEGPDPYTGPVAGAWSAAVGVAHVTEAT